MSFKRRRARVILPSYVSGTLGCTENQVHATSVAKQPKIIDASVRQSLISMHEDWVEGSRVTRWKDVSTGDISRVE